MSGWRSLKGWRKLREFRRCSHDMKGLRLLESRANDERAPQTLGIACFSSCVSAMHDAVATSPKLPVREKIKMVKMNTGK